MDDVNRNPGIKVPINVLHVIGSLGCGGAQVLLKYIVENIDAQKVKAIVYPLRSKGISVPIRGCVIKLPYSNYDPRKFFTILRLCREYNVDILHAHLEKPAIVCLIATFFCKMPLIIHEHGPVVAKGLSYSLYRFMLTLFWPRASAIIATSNYIADFLTHEIKIKPDKITVVPNAVQFDIFDSQKISRDLSRQKLGISQDDIVLGFVGRPNHQKGADLLIKATALLLQQSQHCLLLLAGDSSERKALEKLAQRLGIIDRVRFLGFRTDIPEVMAAFDIGVVPSRLESFGIVCLELMRMRIPVISSGVGGMAEYITNEATGLLLKENTPEEIRNCVERLANDKQLRQRLIENGYKLTEKYSVKKYVETIRQLYQKLCKPRS